MSTSSQMLLTVCGLVFYNSFVFLTLIDSFIYSFLTFLNYKAILYEEICQ